MNTNFQNSFESVEKNQQSFSNKNKFNGICLNLNFGTCLSMVVFLLTQNSLANAGSNFCENLYAVKVKKNSNKAVLVNPVDQSNFYSQGNSEINLLQMQSGQGFVRLPDGRIIPVKSMSHKIVRDDAPGRQPKYNPTPAQLPATPPANISEISRNQNSNTNVGIISSTTRRVFITDMTGDSIGPANEFQMAKWPSGVGPKSRPNKKRTQKPVTKDPSDFEQGSTMITPDSDGSGRFTNIIRRNYDQDIENERGQSDEFYTPNYNDSPSSSGGSYSVLFITPQGQVFAPQ